MVSSAPSSQLHSLPLIPEHTHNIERIDDTRTCRHGPQTRMTRVHAAVVPCPHHLRHLPPFCVSATPKSFVRRRPLAPLPALALSRASGNDIRDLAAFVVSEVPPAHPEVCDYPAMEAKGAAPISWSLVPASRTTTAARFGSSYHLHRRSRVPAGPFCCRSHHRLRGVI